MIGLRRVETDAELEAWRQVRIAVLPNERTATVEELRAAARPGLVYLLAELDAELAGSGAAGPSDMAGRGFVAPRVLPQARRRGVGSAVLLELAAHLVESGYALAGANVEDPGSLAFAERFGFREVDRQVEQVRSVGTEPPAGPPEGVELVSVAERPELWRPVYESVGAQAFEDMALDQPLDVPLEQWESTWIGAPEAMFVAVADGEVIGCAGLMLDADLPERAENALTAVRRDWRGRGVASALKRATLAWAAENGIREVYTWTQRGNEDMRRLNEHLGYVTRAESISVRAPLPLTVP
jgi:GNAT superfamily N-acetyltransferase